jgi:4,5-DOPA dioxygenase extradiol
MNIPEQMPVLFVGHGSPMNALENNEFSKGWMEIGKTLPKPNADVPVIQLSLNYMQAPQFHYDLAKELSFLRKKGILIIGSGNMVHNLRMVAWDKAGEPEYGFDWAIEANEKMKQFIISGDHGSLIDYQSQGKSFNLAIPTPDHYLPLLYSLALQNEGEQLSFFNDKPVMGSLTMTSVRIG